MPLINRMYLTPGLFKNIKIETKTTPLNLSLATPSLVQLKLSNYGSN